MRFIKFWVGAMAGGMLLTACGDGSVRSPGDIGSGPLESIRLVCVTPSDSTCPTLGGADRVQAGTFVNFRVIGTFRNGSSIDITDRERISFRTEAGDPIDAVTLTQTGADKGRVRGNTATEPGAPATVIAVDDEGAVDPAEVSREIAVFGGLPESIEVFANSACTQRADELSLPSGATRQLSARVTFDNPDVDAICVSDDPRLSWNSPDTNPDGSTVITSGGLFSGKNANTEETAEFRVTASFEPEPEPAQQFSPLNAQASITVAPAQLVCNAGLDLSPSLARVALSPAPLQYSVEATFQLDGDSTITASVLRSTAFTSDIPSRADFLDPDEAPGALTLKQATDDGAPVTVAASLKASNCPGGTLEGTSEVTILEPDFASLMLVPLGVEPYEAAGLLDFPDASENDIQAERDRIANDAQFFGLNANGRVPCSGNGCPSGELAQNQALPGKISLAYVVAGVFQGESEKPVVLRDLQEVCDNGDILPVSVTGSDDTIDVLTELPDVGAIRSDSGTRVVLVDGLQQGTGTVRARLGADFSDPQVGNGFNCQEPSLDGEPQQQPVEDAEQSVRVGIVDDNGNAVDIQRTTFNIDKNFACVGFTNAEDTVTGEDILGRDKLLTSLTFEVPGSDGNPEQIIVNANQSRATSFRARGGPATIDYEACRTDDPESAGEEDPSITITNALLEERGVMRADGATGLAANCAAAELDPEVASLPGFEDSPTQRTATVVVLPVDDDILSGESALSGEEVDGLCGGLGSLFTLSIGQFADGQGAGVLVETIGLLEQILGPVLNNEIIEDDVSTELEGLLNELSGGLLGPLLTDALAPLTDQLLPLLGLGGGESPTGFALLPTLVDGLGQVTDELNAQLVEAGGGEEPPPTTDPGDPFAE